MCRNIRVLHNFEPPSTPDEMRDAALQYARKVSGIGKPVRANQAAFDAAVDAVAAATEKLLGALPPSASKRTREQEREKGRMRWAARTVRMGAGG